MMIMSIIMAGTPAHLYAAEQLYDVMKAQNAEVPNDEQESLSNENIDAQETQPVENDIQNDVGTEHQENAD